jgi:hypothetical protein
MVQQGHMGDCANLSALTPILAKDPNFLSKFITDNKDGTYSATFYAFGPNSKTPTPVRVTVDGQIPLYGADQVSATQHGTQIVGAHCSNPSIIDVSLYEKLFAKFRGGYDVLNDGDYGGPAMRALTGKAGEKTFDIFPDVHGNASELVNFLKRNGDRAMTAFTYCGAFSASYDPTVDYKGVGILPAHDYAVMGFSFNGTPLQTPADWAQVQASDPSVLDNLQVTLQNPWGMYEPGSGIEPSKSDVLAPMPGQDAPAAAPFDGTDNGQFTLPLKTFLAYYAGVEANQLPDGV